MQLVDLAFGFGDDPHAQIGEPLVETGDVLLIPRKTVKRFRDQDIKAAGHGALLHILEARSKMSGAAHRLVGKDIHN